MAIPYILVPLATMTSKAWPVLVDASIKGSRPAGGRGLVDGGAAPRSAAQRHLVWLLAFSGAPGPADVFRFAAGMADSAALAGPRSPWQRWNRRRWSPRRPCRPSPAARRRSRTISWQSRGEETPPISGNRRQRGASDSPRAAAGMADAAELGAVAGGRLDLGMAALALRYGFGVVCLWRTARGARSVEDQQWRVLLDETAHALVVRRRVTLLESPRCTIPMTWGALRPVILLPIGRAWPVERRQVVRRA